MDSDAPTVDAPESLGSRARTAIVWKFLSQGTTYGVQIGTTIVLCRLLMPRDFGILGMATMVTGLVQIFQDLGMGQALVQRRTVERHHVAGAFWGTMLMGLCLFAMAALIAPWVGLFFREPRMVPVLRAIAFTFIISPFGTITPSQRRVRRATRHLTRNNLRLQPSLCHPHRQTPTLSLG